MNSSRQTRSTNYLSKLHARERGKFWWLAPRSFDLVSSALYIAVVVTFFTYGCNCDFAWWRAISLLINIAVLLFIDRLEYALYAEQTPARIALILLSARIILIGVATFVDDFTFSPFLYLIPPFLAYLYFKNYVGYGLVVLAWCIYLLEMNVRIPEWYNDERLINNLIIFTVGLIFVITMANTVARERKSRMRAESLLAELEESHAQLKEYAAQVEDLATTKERNRLARDIHDSLGHYLTVINVQLEKALTFRDRKPQEADQAVRDAKYLASEALQDVRRSVGALRVTSQNVVEFVPTLNDLVERVRDNQLAVELHVTGSEEGFSPQALITLYRVVQEGLTNVQKHAHATLARVTIDFTATDAHLCLSDNGQGFTPETLHNTKDEHERGYGLQGLQERLELVGGSMHLESGPGAGTCLSITIPRSPLVQSSLTDRQPKQGNGWWCA